MADIRVRSVSELAKAAYDLFGDFNVYRQIEQMNQLPDTRITESQFAQIIGRARMYQNMPFKVKKRFASIPINGFTGELCS